MIFLADGFAQVVDAAQGNAEALAITNGGLSSVDGTDPAGVGGRRLFVISNRTWRTPMEDPGTHWFLHFWMQRTANATGTQTNDFLQPESAAGNRTLHLATHRQSRVVYIRLNGTDLWTFSGDAIASQHYTVEVVEHATEGIVRGWKNGVLEYTGTNLNTSRAFTIDRMRFGGTSTSSGFNVAITHLIVADENLGAGAVVQYFPVSSDETPNEWVRNAGATDWEAVDDVPHDGDTTYLSSEDAGDRTTHRATISGLEGRDIIAARVGSVARLEEESEDRLALRLGAAETIKGSLDDTLHLRKNGGWHEADGSSNPWTDTSLAATDIQIEHLAPEA